MYENEKEKLEMLERQNVLLKKELHEALDELLKYKEKFGELSSPSAENKVDIKKLINESKDKIQDKLNDDKVKETIEKGKDISEKAKSKVLEGSSIAVDAFKTAKKVFFNKDIKSAFKEEFNNQRKTRKDFDEKN